MTAAIWNRRSTAASVTVRSAMSVHDLAAVAVPTVVTEPDAQRRRTRRQVPELRGRVHHRASLLQGAAKHGGPRRQPVDSRRHPAGNGDVYGRERVGVADSDTAERRSPSPRTRCTSRRTTRPAVSIPRTTAISVQRFVNGPLEALANGVSGGNGVYRYGAGGFPTEYVSTTQITGWTSSS